MYLPTSNAINQSIIPRIASHRIASHRESWKETSTILTHIHIHPWYYIHTPYILHTYIHTVVSIPRPIRSASIIRSEQGGTLLPRHLPIACRVVPTESYFSTQRSLEYSNNPRASLSFVLYPPTAILHPPSSTLHSTFYILHPTSYILHPAAKLFLSHTCLLYTSLCSASIASEEKFESTRTHSHTHSHTYIHP